MHVRCVYFNKLIDRLIEVTVTSLRWVADVGNANGVFKFVSR